MNRNRTSVILLILPFLCVGWAQGDVPGHLRMILPFEDGVHACEGAAQPFVAAGNVQLIPAEDRRGNVLRFRALEPDKPSALVIAGVNLPHEKGTVGAWFRLQNDTENDARRNVWLLSLIPRVGEPFRVLPGSKGTGLAVVQEKNGTMALYVYQLGQSNQDMFFGAGIDLAEPDTVAIRIPLPTEGRNAWHHVRLGWNRTDRTVWLAVDDVQRQARVDFRPAVSHCLLVGSPPLLHARNGVGLLGDIDDLVIDARDPASAPGAGRDKPQTLPKMAARRPMRESAQSLTDSPLGEPLETMVRTHLRMVMDSQTHGGWAYTRTWPSGMNFLSTGVVVPYSQRYFCNSKDQTSAYAAILLATAYDVLADHRYLAAAKKTADAYLQFQAPRGWWPYSAVHHPEQRRLAPLGHPRQAPLEDHVQAYPIVLMQIMHRLTGDAKYWQAAEKGVELILHTQNPNGSWPHRYDLALDRGLGARSKYHQGGCINDNATSDQMRVMLLAYRQTGEPKYLASVLKAADWLVEAFIDKRVKGWAPQYDRNNVPVEGRHFEPAAVSLSEGMKSPVSCLVLAWRLTGDDRYLAPVRKWIAWMWQHRVFLNEEKTQWGWFTHYDIKTGKPIRMWQREIHFLTDPAEAKDRGYTDFLKQTVVAMKSRTIDRAERLKARKEKLERISQWENRALKGAEPDRFPIMRSFDWTMGSWPTWGDADPVGRAMAPQHPRLALALDDLYTMLLLKEPADTDRRFATFRPADWTDVFNLVMSPEAQAQPLTDEERKAAERRRNKPSSRARAASASPTPRAALH